MFRKLTAALVAVFVSAVIAYSATVPFLVGPVDMGAMPGVLNTLIQSINTNITPQSMGSFATPRNFLDNGAMQVQQRGTGTVTCGQTSGIPSSAYSADRWGCIANVGSGAGRTQVITSSPSPPTGFSTSVKMWRNSGALTQAVCAWQEIPSFRATMLAGQTVMVSAYLQALAGLAADNSNAANLVIVTGTGTDEGLGTFTASPAITPAFTGVATLQNTALTITTAWVRYNGVSVAVPTSVTEIAVGICFTPTATGAGATDGLAFTGVQLEPLGANSTAPSPYEQKPLGVETEEAFRYFQILTEPASGVQVPVFGNSTSATAAAMAYSFPVVMRVAPTFTALGTALSGSTWTNKCGNVNNALATTFIVTATANSVSGASLTVTSSGSTIGFGCVLVGAGGGSILSWSADF